MVEYSGYDPSNPANTTFAQLFNALGYAYVGVNIRGTGCSGGSFRNFEPVQSLDGYDVIETIAAQSWAKFHKVGMVGISYPGISQLYVAQTRPPSLVRDLAAVGHRRHLPRHALPGRHPQHRLRRPVGRPTARPTRRRTARAGSRPRVDGGDTVCAANQALRLQNPDPLQLIKDNPFYTKKVGDPISPSLFAHKINVPVFLAGAWQDEQTGGHFPAMLDDFTSSPHLYATMTNGSHTESLSLGVFDRYADFLDLYVGRRVPTGAKGFVGPDPVAARSRASRASSLPLGINYTGLSYAQALKKFESQDPIRILFEEGAADGQPSGSPLPRFETSFKSWPIAKAKATAWYLTPGGRLPAQAVEGGSRQGPGSAATAPTRRRSRRRRTPARAPASGRRTRRTTGSRSRRARASAGSAPPLKKTVVADRHRLGGPLGAHARARHRPRGHPQRGAAQRPGGLRAVRLAAGQPPQARRARSTRRSRRCTPTARPTRGRCREAKFSKIRVELFPFAQPFRKGSRIRITVDAPGNARPLWAFDTIAHGERVQIATDRAHRSRIVLPLVSGIKVPDEGAARAARCAASRAGRTPEVARPSGRMTPMRVGLTGGIASGKSTVSGDPGRAGRGHHRRRQARPRGGREGHARAGAGGRGVRAGDPDRRTVTWTARRSAGSSSTTRPSARLLEGIVHPLVFERYAALEASAPKDGLVIHDIPLLAESGRADTFDAVIVVETPAEVQVERMLRDRGWTREDAESRIAAQATPEQRRAIATYLIVNTGTREELRARVEEVYARAGRRRR